jgi:hypothetical protein
MCPPENRENPTLTHTHFQKALTIGLCHHNSSLELHPGTLLDRIGIFPTRRIKKEIWPTYQDIFIAATKVIILDLTVFCQVWGYISTALVGQVR